MYALLAPGQGAQTPRMLLPWLRDPRAAALLDTWSAAAGIDLIHLGTKASSEEIARTENTQPLLVAQALLVGTALPVGSAARVVAGHSVGELAAAAWAGVLRPDDAVRLARARGIAMADACAETPTTMAAVVGGEPAVVEARLAELGLYVANHNGTGQVVAAGACPAVDELQANPPAGSAVRPLAVAGAFHTPFMSGACQAFADAVSEVAFADPVHPVVSNIDGELVTDGVELSARLVAQLTAPVRWDLCLATIDRCAPDPVIAAPPGRVLAAIMARQLPHRRTLAVSAPRDLDNAVAALQKDAPAASTAIGAGV